mmetsp:Transcript_25263/g.34948  ORF Transcript_25263/g.34948 Transcript_25263/m.34948 type:complete len:125 (-) Transcript_25263:796-1170(-)
MADTEPSVQQKMKMFEKQGKPNKPTSSRPPAGAVSRRIQQVERTTNKSFGGKESEVTKSIKDNPFMRQHTDGAMKNGAIKKKLPPPKGEGEGGGGNEERKGDGKEEEEEEEEEERRGEEGGGKI